MRFRTLRLRLSPKTHQKIRVQTNDFSMYAFLIKTIRFSGDRFGVDTRSSSRMHVRGTSISVEGAVAYNRALKNEPKITLTFNFSNI